MAKRNVLIVDADSRSVPVLEVSLRKAGYSVTTSPSAEEALEFLEYSRPDLVLCDTVLPKMDGFAFAEHVRSRISDLPIIFLSSDAGVDAKVRGLNLGVEDYLAKPIFVKEIVTRVNLVLQRSERQGIERRSLTKTRFSGHLSEMGLVDLLQTIDISRKSGVLQLSQGERIGKVFFDEGTIVHAELGRLRGDMAVYRFLVWNEGAFDLEFCPVKVDRTIHASIQGLLMEGMRRVDEWGRMLEQLPPLSGIYAVDDASLAERLGEIPDEVNSLLRLFDGKRSLLRVVDEREADDLETLGTISKLYFEGLIIPTGEKATFDDDSAVNERPPLPSMVPMAQQASSDIGHLRALSVVPATSVPGTEAASTPTMEATPSTAHVKVAPGPSPAPEQRATSELSETKSRSPLEKPQSAGDNRVPAPSEESMSSKKANRRQKKRNSLLPPGVEQNEDDSFEEGTTSDDEIFIGRQSEIELLDASSETKRAEAAAKAAAVKQALAEVKRAESSVRLAEAKKDTAAANVARAQVERCRAEVARLQAEAAELEAEAAAMSTDAQVAAIELEELRAQRNSQVDREESIVALGVAIAEPKQASLPPGAKSSSNPPPKQAANPSIPPAAKAPKNQPSKPNPPSAKAASKPSEPKASERDPKLTTSQTIRAITDTGEFALAEEFFSAKEPSIEHETWEDMSMTKAALSKGESVARTATYLIVALGVLLIGGYVFYNKVLMPAPREFRGAAPSIPVTQSARPERVAAPPAAAQTAVVPAPAEEVVAEEVVGEEVAAEGVEPVAEETPPEVPPAEASSEYPALLEAAMRARGAARIRALETAIAANPNGFEALEELAWLKVNASRYAEAAELAQRATALNPTSSRAWLVLGASKTELREPDAARAALEACVTQGQGRYVRDCRGMMPR